jgi:hypothetical protein
MGPPGTIVWIKENLATKRTLLHRVLDHEREREYFM